MRTVETLDENLQTVNVWEVPENVSLAKTIEKQERPEFRDLYLVGQRPVKI